MRESFKKLLHKIIFFAIIFACHAQMKERKFVLTVGILNLKKRKTKKINVFAKLQ